MPEHFLQPRIRRKSFVFEPFARRGHGGEDRLRRERTGGSSRPGKGGFVTAERYANRRDAGRRLAEDLAEHAGQPNTIVLALPRGGVPVGYEVAHQLGVPMDIFLVRKLGVPGHEELAMGAIASGGVRVINDQVVQMIGVREDVIDAVAERERTELQRREKAYRGDKPPAAVRGATVILVDDGLATGSTMRAAVEAIRRSEPKRVIVAVPVAARETCDEIRQEVDEVVCSMTPEPFHAVGLWYDTFDQTTDDEVRDLLGRAGD